MEIFIKALLSVGLDRVAKWMSNQFSKPLLSAEELKKKTHVLFVDDEPVGSLVENIQNAGWTAKQVYDVENLDCPDVKNADIIFMDYKNVGIKLTPSEEGIGLMKALKRKYPEKHIIFYSGYAGTIPGQTFYGVADDWIIKSADTYEYIDRIEKAATNIYG